MFLQELDATKSSFVESQNQQRQEVDRLRSLNNQLSSEYQRLEAELGDGYAPDSRSHDALSEAHRLQTLVSFDIFRLCICSNTRIGEHTEC